MGADEWSDRGEGHVAVVTGGGSGIGARIGTWLARNGVDVVLADLDESGARTVADDVEADGGTARGVYTDVTDESSVGTLFETVEAEFGRLDYLFPNAGIVGPVELDETSIADWRQVIDVNLNGAFLTVTEGLDLLTADGGGHAVLTASISGRQPKPVMVPYRCSKAAVIMLVHCLAEPLGPEVKINALCPGPIDTPLLRDLQERRAEARGMTFEEFRDEKSASMALGRTPEPEDLLGLLDYLLFGDAFVTGHEFYLDGGGYQVI